MLFQLNLRKCTSHFLILVAGGALAIAGPGRYSYSDPAPLYPLSEKGWRLVRIVDGDTFTLIIPELPPEIAEISIRIRGVDAPELKGHCEAERRLAREAKLFTERWLQSGEAGEITLSHLAWDKYGGRLLADVFVHGKNVGTGLLAAQLARPYDGAKRKNWCE